MNEPNAVGCIETTMVEKLSINKSLSILQDGAAVVAVGTTWPVKNKQAQTLE